MNARAHTRAFLLPFHKCKQVEKSTTSIVDEIHTLRIICHTKFELQVVREQLEKDSKGGVGEEGGGCKGVRVRERERGEKS